MRPTTVTLALLAGCALAGGCTVTPAERARDQAAAATTQQKLDARLAGLSPGPQTDCIPQYPTVHSEPYGAKIVYIVSNRLVYVNDTGGGCEGLDRGDYLVTISHGGRLCRGDIGQTFQTGTNVPTGSCALGSFTPYSRP
ncbi:hypothetical protein [Sphingomonas bacterium]|uniref:hypothetical protein n=1 Tax=Sphingomonas bacterium TaxID=1895847 RepID=UPI0015766775|nr:hypothetical protein [Sphingomonas bacterium]